MLVYASKSMPPGGRLAARPPGLQRLAARPPEPALMASGPDLTASGDSWEGAQKHGFACIYKHFGHPEARKNLLRGMKKFIRKKIKNLLG